MHAHLGEHGPPLVAGTTRAYLSSAPARYNPPPSYQSKVRGSDKTVKAHRVYWHVYNEGVSDDDQDLLTFIVRDVLEVTKTRGRLVT